MPSRQLKHLAAALAAALVLGGCATGKTIAIEQQGSFTVGGSYVTHPGTFKQENFIAPDGQRAYGDFAYVKYQTPANAKPLPLIFQHGGAQSSRTWESTIDGREGFDTLFLRKGYSVYTCSTSRAAANPTCPPSPSRLKPPGPATRCMATKPCGCSRAWGISMPAASP